MPATTFGFFMFAGKRSGNIRCALRCGAWPFAPGAFIDPTEHGGHPGLHMAVKPRVTPWNVHWAGVYNPDTMLIEFLHITDDEALAGLMYYSIPPGPDTATNRAILGAIDLRLRGGPELEFYDYLDQVGVPQEFRACFSTERNVFIGHFPDPELVEPLPAAAAARAIVLSDNAKQRDSRAQYAAFRAREQDAELLQAQNDLVDQASALQAVDSKLWYDQLKELLKDSMPFTSGASPDTARAMVMFREFMGAIHILQSPEMGFGVAAAPGQDDGKTVQGVDLAEAARRSSEASSATKIYAAQQFQMHVAKVIHIGSEVYLRANITPGAQKHVDMNELPPAVIADFMLSMKAGVTSGDHAPMSLKMVLGELIEKAEKKARASHKNDRGASSSAGEAKKPKFATGVRTGSEYYGPPLQAPVQTGVNPAATADPSHASGAGRGRGSSGTSGSSVRGGGGNRAFANPGNFRGARGGRGGGRGGR